MLELAEETRATSNEKISIEKKKNYGGILKHEDKMRIETRNVKRHCNRIRAEGNVLTCHGCGSKLHLIKDCNIPRPIPYRTPEEREELARGWKLREGVPTYRAEYGNSDEEESANKAVNLGEEHTRKDEPPIGKNDRRHRNRESRN